MVEDKSSVALRVQRIEDALVGDELAHLERSLVSYLARQRWFGSKSRAIEKVEIFDFVKLPHLNASIVFIRVIADDASTSTYQVALAITDGEVADGIRSGEPSSVIATGSAMQGSAILHDALSLEEVRQSLLHFIEGSGELKGRTGVLRGQRNNVFVDARGIGPLPARLGSAEQSNSSILYGTKLILKLFRRLETGENPDTEISRHLTESAQYKHVAPFLGDITFYSESRETTTLAMLQELVINEGDGWQWTLDELSRYYDAVATLQPPQDVMLSFDFDSEEEEISPIFAREPVRRYLEASALLGQRTAEMHASLAMSTEDPAFKAEPFTYEDLIADVTRIETQLSLSLEALERTMSQLTGSPADHAALVLSRRVELFSRARIIATTNAEIAGERIRIHGDFHLGQVLRSREDYVILDFEGEPARSLAERRVKQSPLKDVAGMIRSFSYAAYVALDAFSHRRSEDAKSLESWARLWQNVITKSFVSAYRVAINATNPHLIPQGSEAQNLLNAYLLEKALYELRYELDNRPAWVKVPLTGILALR